MADSDSEHPYGTCEACGAGIWQCGGNPGDERCPTCRSDPTGVKMEDARKRVAKAVRDVETKTKEG